MLFTKDESLCVEAIETMFVVIGKAVTIVYQYLLVNYSNVDINIVLSFDGYRVRREPNMNDRHNQASLVSVPNRGLMIIGGTG